MTRVTLESGPRAYCSRAQSRFAAASKFGAAFVGLGLICVSADAVQAETDRVSVELNKLEPQGQGCRAYMVVNNTSAASYTSLKLEFVVFQPDGVIGKRFSIDLAPVRPKKRTVKLFDIDQTNCDQVSSFLVNEAIECKTETGPVDDCLGRLDVSSITKAQLTK